MHANQPGVIVFQICAVRSPLAVASMNSLESVVEGPKATPLTEPV